MASESAIANSAEDTQVHISPKRDRASDVPGNCAMIGTPSMGSLSDHLGRLRDSVAVCVSCCKRAPRSSLRAIGPTPHCKKSDRSKLQTGVGAGSGAEDPRG